MFAKHLMPGEPVTYNDGIEAAARVMDDLDRGGWFAMAIRAIAKGNEDDTGTRSDTAARRLRLARRRRRLED